MIRLYRLEKLKKKEAMKGKFYTVEGDVDKRD